MRPRVHYCWQVTRVGKVPGEHYAMVLHIDETTESLYSKACCPVKTVQPTSFWPVIQSFPNQSLWWHFVCNGDGKWILGSMILGMLAIVHDGSYQDHISRHVSSAGGLHLLQEYLQYDKVWSR